MDTEMMSINIANRMTNLKDLYKLVEKYDADRNFYLSDRYNETQVRSNFLDSLFELLCWDIKNKVGRPTNEREVILEEPLKAGASKNTKKPDYTFRLFAERKFFLEAKKPHVHINDVDAPARQARRYGYTANLKISVLSNFEYLMIYDTSVKVEETDTNQKALIKKYRYTEYEDKFEELQRLLGKESVYSGQFDEEWKDIEVRLKQSGYPDILSHLAYFMIRIRKPNDTVPDLQKLAFNVKEIPILYWSNHKMPFIMAKLKDLQKVIDRM